MGRRGSVAARLPTAVPGRFPKPAPRQARGGRTRGPRVLLARAWRSLREAALAAPGGRGLPPPPQAEVAQRLFPATEVLFGPTGGPPVGLRGFRPSLRRPRSFSLMGANTAVHARCRSAQPRGCAPEAWWPCHRRRGAAGLEGVNSGDVRACDCWGGEM